MFKQIHFLYFFTIFFFVYIKMSKRKINKIKTAKKSFKKSFVLR